MALKSKMTKLGSTLSMLVQGILFVHVDFKYYKITSFSLGTYRAWFKVCVKLSSGITVVNVAVSVVLRRMGLQ